MMAIAAIAILVAIFFWLYSKRQIPSTAEVLPAQESPVLEESVNDDLQVPEDSFQIKNLPRTMLLETFRVMAADDCEQEFKLEFPENLAELAAAFEEEMEIGFDARVALVQSKVAATTEILNVSADSEHLHLSALLSKDPATSVDFVARAMAANPNVAKLAYDAVWMCAKAKDVADCPIEAWERRLVDLDKENSEAWGLIAKNRYERGEVDAAFEAMRRAASAAETRDYYAETIEMAERSFAAGGLLSLEERIVQAYFVGNTFSLHTWAPLGMCREQGAMDAEWARVCLAYGDLTEKRGQNDGTKLTGIKIQKYALEQLGELRDKADVEARLKEFGTWRPPDDMLAMLSTLLIATSSDAWSGYVASYKADGERAANTHLRSHTCKWLGGQAGAEGEISMEEMFDPYLQP